MSNIKVVVLLVRQLRHGFTKTAKVSPNLTVAHCTGMRTLRHDAIIDKTGRCAPIYEYAPTSN